PARMGNSQTTVERRFLQGIFDIDNLSRMHANLDLSRRSKHVDTRRIITAILQPLEPPHLNTCYIALYNKLNDATHNTYSFLSFLTGLCQLSILRCLPRATANWFFFTAVVITEPAPTVAPFSTVTGATSAVLEPIITSSAILVLC